jgi:hypothetical protein
VEFEITERWPGATCPSCGQAGVPLMFGMVLSEHAHDAHNAGRLVLGGCVRRDNHDWACLDRHRWPASDRAAWRAALDDALGGDVSDVVATVVSPPPAQPTVSLDTPVVDRRA